MVVGGQVLVLNEEALILFSGGGVYGCTEGVEQRINNTETRRQRRPTTHRQRTDVGIVTIFRNPGNVILNCDGH